MERRALKRDTTSLLQLLFAAAVGLAALGGATASRAALSPSDAPTISPQSDTLSTNALRLRRAAFEQAARNPAGVVQALEPVDFRAAAFAGADRAAFLLGQAYLQLAAYARFEALAADLVYWKVDSPYTRWIAYQRSLLAAQAGDQDAARHLLAGGAAAGEAQALSLYGRALAAADANNDATALWTELAAQPHTTELLRTLVGAALLQLATIALERGGDPAVSLRKVPEGSRYSPTARHMLGLVALEHGDSTGARALAELLAKSPEYPGRRQVWLGLAGHALREQRWREAFERYERAATEWSSQRDRLQALLAQRDFQPLWSAWENESPLSDALLLDALPAQTLAAQLAAEATNLSAHPKTLPPALGAAQSTEAASPGVAPPSAAARHSVAAAVRQLAEATYALERNRWERSRESARLEDWQRYLRLGTRRVAEETSGVRKLEPATADLSRRVDLALVRLDAEQQASLHYIAERTKSLREELARQRLLLRAMNHFYLKGPNGENLSLVPANTPTAEELIRHELALLDGLERSTLALDAGAPHLLAAVSDWARGLGLPNRAAEQERQVQRDLAWAGALSRSVDSSFTVGPTSDVLRQLAARMRVLEDSVSLLSSAAAELRDRVADGAVRIALAQLVTEREGIDYGLAAAAYGGAIQLARAVGPDTPDNEQDTPESAAWRDRTIALHRDFLEQYPVSWARGETRFRLADLLLLDARFDFRRDMAHYVGSPSEGGGRAALPVLDHAPALALYEKMLAEDADYPHRDAVLFNAGMILTESADRRAARFFEDLVATTPDSPMAQEAYLRLGDIEFNEKRFAACVPLYERSAAGADTGLRIIALYKVGWAQFNEDRFLDAGDAFRSVLDLYHAAPASAGTVDVRDEAESYLIHTLARAGGAPAFAAYFDRIGERDYEMDLLLAMGQHFRRFSLFEDAAAADRLYIERAPLTPQALVSAERLTETYRRWNHPEREREAARELAPQFAPGGAWAAAQTSDSLRASGAAFAKASWGMLAQYHHRRALGENDDREWEDALAYYRTMLRTWPADPEGPLLSLRAGEASARLGQYENAISYFDAAAAAGSDTLLEIALRERMAAADAWYETTRESKSPETLGSEARARAVLDAGDELLRRFPAHAGAGDILWRQGNLAFAHGWYERAAGDLSRLYDGRPTDERAPFAASLRADALFQLARYSEAGEAFEAARLAAVHTGQDSLARHAAASIPVCHYRAAEAAVAADSTDFHRHATLFESVATGWPDYEHSALAQYRAGLVYAQGKETAESERALRDLITRFPTSEYVKDAYLKIATNWEETGAPDRAAEAFQTFSEKFPDDESADDALLKAADYFATSGGSDRADAARLEYLRRFPNDLETGAAFREEFARRDLAGVGPGRPVSALLPAASGERQTASAPSHLAEYVSWAAMHPELASAPLLAEVRYLQAEEARGPYGAQQLDVPLKKSLPVKQRLLDSLVARYRRCIDLGVAEWAHASAYRIGEAIVGFGEAVEASERPRDLRGDDLLAYNEVVADEAQSFYDRGELVWADLLRERSEHATSDPWLERTQSALWARLGQRFLFHPEVVFPTIVATPSPGQPAGGSTGDAARALEAHGAAGSSTLARQPGEQP